MFYRAKVIISLLLSLRNELLIFSGLVSLGLYAQNPVEQHIEVRFRDGFQSVASYRQIIRYDRLMPGDTLYFYNWLNAYSDIRSGIGEAISGQYRLHFAFSSEKERGFLKLDTSEFYTVRQSGIDLLKVILNENFPPERNEIVLEGKLKLPDAKFTGTGYRGNGVFLREWLISPVPAADFKPYHNKNLHDLPLVSVKSRLVLSVHCPGCYVSAGQVKSVPDGRTEVVLESGDNRLDLAFYTKKPLRLVRKGTRFMIDGDFFPSADEVTKTIALDRVVSFLEQKHFRLPPVVTIDAETANRYPVYGIDWLPVMNPFDRNFVLELNLLKQILSESVRRWHVDLRSDYAFWKGLQQFLMLDYVSAFYPGVRLAGKTGHWPFLKMYEFFRYPYIYKFPLSYYYMVSMNRDQSPALPADALTNFNREIAVPYKSALAWYFLREFSRKQAFDAWWENLLNQVYEIEIQPYQILKEGNFPSAALKFFEGNYFRTAFKPDFSLKGTPKGDSVLLCIRNKGKVSLPVILSFREGNKDFKNQILYFQNKDTVLKLPYSQSFTYYLNRNILYPEPEKRNNIWPGNRRKPEFRPVSDLQNPFKRQFFFNPSVDYNLYDGLITGMAFSNKTLLDKSFTWELKPDYAWRSQTLTGSGNFKWIKHYVRPYFHGFSLGGYFDIYHYDFDRFYRTFDVYFTLNFKNRQKKLMQGNTVAAEWLYVFKDAPVQDETTRYGVFRLSDLQFKKAFLNRYSLFNSLEFHRKFVKWQTEFKFRRFIDRFRQFEFRLYGAWMPVNRTQTDYFSMALSRPADYLFKYHYYGRSERQGLMAQQYIYAEGAFKVFYPSQFANQAMLVNNLNIGIWKRFNLFVDYGWLKNRNEPWRFHYDAGLRFYLVPDFFEFYFPVVSDLGWERFDKTYWSRIRIMFVFSLPDLFKMFSRSWY